MKPSDELLRGEIGRIIGPMIYKFYGEEIADDKWVAFMDSVKVAGMSLFEQYASRREAEAQQDLIQQLLSSQSLHLITLSDNDGELRRNYVGFNEAVSQLKDLLNSKLAELKATISGEEADE